MVSVEEAKKIIIESTKLLDVKSIDVQKILDHVLSKEVVSAIDLPPFPQSAMDGYAIRHEDLARFNNRLKLSGEMPAGSAKKQSLDEGTAIRIFTGAAVPENADTVVMQEKTSKEGEWVVINETIAKGIHIRRKGEEVNAGMLAFEKGTCINAAGVGYLSALGYTEVEVVSKPRIAILTTGDELIAPGKELDYGQVYESNSASLSAALKSTGFEHIEHYKLKDDYDATLASIAAAIKKVDVIILSGGISVGDYDYVGKALKELGTHELFYKIRQKPGKPMYYGKLEDKPVFALPGNPASLLSCFYEYVLPALRKMAGKQACFLDKRMVPLTQEYFKKGDRAQFLRGKLVNDQVTILDGQSSFMLQAFSMANCLIYIPEDKKEILQEELVEIHLLP